MRRRARVDDNHGDIVQALRQIGCSVQSLASIGEGCPDLLVGYRGRNVLFEIKDGSKSPSRRKLTADEKEWLEGWRGQAFIVEDAAEAIGFLE